MNELLNKALERRAEILRELEAIDGLISAYNQPPVIRVQTEKSMDQAELWESLDTERGLRVSALKDTLDAAEALILAAGRPLTRGELVPRLIAKGFKLDGRDQNKVFGTNMWRSNRFWNLKRVGYWPKSTPLPVGFDGIEIRQSSIEEHLP